jgi:hypothetical protein
MPSPETFAVLNFAPGDEDSVEEPDAPVGVDATFLVPDEPQAVSANRITVARLAVANHRG